MYARHSTEHYLVSQPYYDVGRKIITLILLLRKLELREGK